MSLNPQPFTVMNKSLRPLCKSDDFQHLACDCISHILLLHHKFVFFVVFHFVPILTSVHISWLTFLVLTDFFWCLKWARKVSKRGSEGSDSCLTRPKSI